VCQRAGSSREDAHPAGSKLKTTWGDRRTTARVVVVVVVVVVLSSYGGGGGVVSGAGRLVQRCCYVRW
jgi:hypothetical protein